MPIFIVDPEGNLLFYNEPAEIILGQRFRESGKLPQEEWSTIFQFKDETGKLLDPTEVPLAITLEERRPVHRRLWLHGLDDSRSLIEATCLPLEGQANRFLGAMAIFWEVSAK